MKQKHHKSTHSGNFSSFFTYKYTKGLLTIVKAESPSTKFF
ncbi:hypothetical protein [Bacteroides congonensis]